METAELLHQRLSNQLITKHIFETPQQVVTYMAAMQAQEYAMARWAIGLRLSDAQDELIEKAFNDGEILRTHLLRPTWHFVAPEDIRWLMALTAPRVQAVNNFMYKQCGLDAATFKLSNAIIKKALEGDKFLTRNALKIFLDEKLNTGDGVRLSCLMMQAELDGIVCSGPRVGNQFTYALLEERVKPVKEKTRDEALAELANRFFTSRGPALVQDFATWSGLTLKDAKAGAATLPPHFVQTRLNQLTYIYNGETTDLHLDPFHTFLMPEYDEYGISYKDKSLFFNPPTDFPKNSKLTIPYNRMIVTGGKVVGSWKRTIKGAKIEVETDFFGTPTQKQRKSIELAVEKYCSFAGKTIS